MKTQIQSSITRELIDPETENVLGEIEIDVVGNYFPEERGSRDYYGAQNEPDIPANIEFDSAFFNNEEIELSREEENQAIQALWEAVSFLD